MPSFVVAKPTRADRIEAAGKALYGDKWQSPLSRASGVPQSTIAMVSTGERAVSDDMYRKIAMAFIAEGGRLRKAADKIDDIAGRMLAELDGE